MRTCSRRKGTGFIFSCLALIALSGCIPYLAIIGSVPQVVSCRAVDSAPGDTPDGNPAAGFLAEGQAILVRFSIPMDQESVERVLLFSDEGKNIGGTCRWNDECTLLFTPEEIKSPWIYTLYIGSAARSRGGIPLRSPYSRTFPTSPDRTPPRVLECINSSGDPCSAAGTLEFSLVFSEEIDRASFYSAFSLIPETAGLFEWEEEGGRLHFTSTDTVHGPADFSLHLSRRCCDRAGNHLEEEFTAVIHIGQDYELEVQTFEFRSARGIRSVIPDPPRPVSFDRDESIGIIFNAPVDLPLPEELFRIQPDPGTRVEPGTSPDHMTVSFDAPAAWQDEFCFTIADRRYFLKCDGEYSRPIRLDGLAFCNHMEAEPQVFEELVPNSCVDVVSSDHACLQLTLSHSSHSLVSAVDLMDTLDVWCTNGSAYLQPISIETTGSASTVVGYHFRIERYTPPGLLKISISNALRDSLGNRPEHDIEVSCNL